MIDKKCEELLISCQEADVSHTDVCMASQRERASLDSLTEEADLAQVCASVMESFLVKEIEHTQKELKSIIVKEEHLIDAFMSAKKVPPSKN